MNMTPYQYWKSIVDIKRSWAWDCLISIMGFPLLIRHFILNQGRGFLSWNQLSCIFISCKSEIKWILISYCDGLICIRIKFFTLQCNTRVQYRLINVPIQCTFAVALSSALSDSWVITYIFRVCITATDAIWWLSQLYHYHYHSHHHHHHHHQKESRTHILQKNSRGVT